MLSHFLARWLWILFLAVPIFGAGVARANSIYPVVWDGGELVVQIQVGGYRLTSSVPATLTYMSRGALFDEPGVGFGFNALLVMAPEQRRVEGQFGSRTITLDLPASFTWAFSGSLRSDGSIVGSQFCQMTVEGNYFVSLTGNPANNLNFFMLSGGTNCAWPDSADIEVLSDSLVKVIGNPIQFPTVYGRSEYFNSQGFSVGVDVTPRASAILFGVPEPSTLLLGLCGFLAIAVHFARP